MHSTKNANSFSHVYIFIHISSMHLTITESSSEIYMQRYVPLVLYLMTTERRKLTITYTTESTFFFLIFFYDFH